MLKKINSQYQIKQSNIISDLNVIDMNIAEYMKSHRIVENENKEK